MITPTRLTVFGAAVLLSTGLAFAGKTAAPLSAGTFVNDASQTGLAEVELGKMALEKSQDPDVRKFAERMVQDHSKANEELTEIAQSKNVVVPTALDAKHQKMVNMMKSESGAKFDSDYAKHMAEGHGKAVALFTSASESGSLDHELSDFATKTLPTLKEHKLMAEQLAAAKNASAKTNSQY